MSFLLVISLILIVTKIMEHLAVKLTLPSVVGSLFVGILLGPAVLGVVQKSDGINLLSHIGVILLMFLAGVESDFNRLKKYLKPSVSVAILGIVMPMIMFYVTSMLFGFGSKESLFISLIFSATSLSITIQVLKELNYVQTREGSVVVGAALLDDIMVVILLNVVMSLLTPGVGLAQVGKLLLTTVLFFVGVFAFQRFLLPIVLKLYEKVSVPEKNLALGLALAFFFSYVAETLGMSDIIGAFFAGIMLSQTKVGHEIEGKIDQINRAFFAPVFFVSIGLDLSFHGLGKYWYLIIIFSVLAVLSKYVGGYIGAKFDGFDRKSAAIVGASMISRGEMALILVSLGLKQAIISESLYALIVLVVLISTVAAPILLKQAVMTKQKMLEKERI
ncbi:cation:proton antiporter [Vagococcus xieshaowenii]|uniref:Cation:proton antiporter n=1 Tax=Vagococcus xieshaowenii TaxID=2562451 RepID=A0AAJ5EDD6_9ENTE|nr:cation:proton antiporter [Vagococcus xieshaowenii]QCA27918.1 cation:proton antiporter [Vagococcus xieshaowenii]TFZ39404.1 cation:proton antiporter [Vagococcus xieshaowenii]